MSDNVLGRRDCNQVDDSLLFFFLLLVILFCNGDILGGFGRKC
ncbi:hypothetical protein [Tissierella sp.]|nr:hypothetical protein [Tissierella sp.]MDR7857090.1 hypothetical protein [Tissierella sp.]